MIGKILHLGLIAAVTVGLAWLLIPTAQYLIVGPNIQTEIISLPDVAGTAGRRDLELITLLGRDSIPAILEPEFVTAFEADQSMAPDEPVLGISIGGEHKAYSIKMMSRHEIVNDVVGGQPVAVTW
jgi:hypothetical protein